MTTTEIPNKSTVAQMNRADLDELANDLGLPAEEYGSRAEVIAAIEAERNGASKEEEPDLSYPAYMGIEPGVRQGVEPEQQLITGLAVIPHYAHDGDPRWGDEIAINTDSVVEGEIARVRVDSDPAETDGETIPLFSLDLASGPMRTGRFILGPTSLWTEHTILGGNGTITLVTLDPDTGEEILGATATFTVGPGGPVKDTVDVPPEGDPEITSLNPATIAVGPVADTTITASGTGFDASSVVSVDGTAVTTIFVGDTNLSFVVGAGSQPAAASVEVTVTNATGDPSAPVTLAVV